MDGNVATYIDNSLLVVGNVVLFVMSCNVAFRDGI